MNDRCAVKRTLSPAWTMLGPVLGESLDETVRCKGDRGHDGPHWSTVCPFPGFADQRFTWETTSCRITTCDRVAPYPGALCSFHASPPDPDLDRQRPANQRHYQPGRVRLDDEARDLGGEG